MANMYPKNINEYMPTDSERIVYQELKNQLPDSFDVFYSVSWTSYNAGRLVKSEADFVVASPDYGFLCLEIKGGSSIRIEDNTWYLSDGLWPSQPLARWLPVGRSRASAWRSWGCVRGPTVPVLLGSMAVASLSSHAFCPPSSCPTHHSPRPDGSSRVPQGGGGEDVEESSQDPAQQPQHDLHHMKDEKPKHMDPGSNPLHLSLRVALKTCHSSC